MAHLVSAFLESQPGSMEHNAMLKALKEKPRVTYLGVSEGRHYFEVTSTNKLGVHYPLRLWMDADKAVLESHGVEEKEGQLFLSTPELLSTENGQFWIECWCPGAYPPIDVATGLIAWQPKVCYHQAAVLVEASQQNWW